MPSLYLCYTGLDGFFRIIDLNENLPILSFRSNYGGFNSFQLSSNCEMVALSCQDDSIIILDIDNFKYICLTGHKSFTTRVIFHEFNPYVVRIVSCSSDTFISISEFDRGLTLQWDDEEKRVVLGKAISNSEMPIFRRIAYQSSRAIHMEAQNFVKARI